MRVIAMLPRAGPFLNCVLLAGCVRVSAYTQQGLKPPLVVRAHSTRGVAASTALQHFGLPPALLSTICWT